MSVKEQEVKLPIVSDKSEKKDKKDKKDKKEKKEKKDKKEKKEKKEKRSASEMSPEEESAPSSKKQKIDHDASSTLSAAFSTAGEVASEEDILAFRKKNCIAVSGPKASGIGCYLSFSQAKLDDDVRKCIAHFTTPSLIQAQSWPALLRGYDVIGIAETGYV